MGTHPIFESDFDCLTDKMRLSSRNEGQNAELIEKLAGDRLAPLIELYAKEELKGIIVTNLAERCLKGTKEKLKQIIAFDQAEEGTVQSAVKLSHIDYEQLRIDLAMLKSAQAKSPTSQQNDPIEFGISSTSSVRLAFGCLIKREWTNDVFSSKATFDQLIWTLCIGAPYLTEIITLRQLIIQLAQTPNCIELIEAVCLCRPQWTRIALDALLHTTELSSGHANDLIQGLIRLYPALAHGVLSTCLKSQIHANLLLQLVCRQPPASFLALFDSIHRRQGGSLKWLSSQCHSAAFVRPETKSMLKSKILSIISESASTLKAATVTQAQAALRVWCVLGHHCHVRFALNDTPVVMDLFEATVDLPIVNQSRQFIATATSVALAYGEFSTPAKPAGHSIENHSRLSHWFERVVTKVNSEADQAGYRGESGALAEFFLILSIHFHFEEKGDLERVIQRELPVTTQIKSLTVQRLKNLFTQNLYAQDKLVKLAISVPPTAKLTADNSGYIPLDAVTQLLKTRQFSSNKVQVADWIEHQLRQCRLPLHPTMISLLDYFIRANVPET